MGYMADLVRALLETKSAVLEDVDPGPAPPDRFLVRSNLTGTMQLHEFSLPAGLRQVTALIEPVGTARYLPRQRRAAIEVDRGGDERYQLYLVDLAAAPGRGPASLEGLTALTSDHQYGHRLAGVNPDATLVAYLSNKGNGIDFDLWVCDMVSGEHRCVYADGGWCQPASGFSPDGRWVSLLRPGTRPLDTDLLLVDVATGEVRPVLAHPDEAAEVGSPAWVDATTFFVSCSVGNDHAAVVLYDLTTGEAAPVAGTGENWDSEPVTSNDGGVLTVIENCNGASRMTLFGSGNSSDGADVPLTEPGVVSHVVAPAPVLRRWLVLVLHAFDPKAGRRCVGLPSR